MGSQFPGPGEKRYPGTAIPRLNSDKSFVVSKEKDIPEEK
jgi:hypothetical protein